MPSLSVPLASPPGVSGRARFGCSWFCCSRFGCRWFRCRRLCCSRFRCGRFRCGCSLLRGGSVGGRVVVVAACRYYQRQRCCDHDGTATRSPPCRLDAHLVLPSVRCVETVNGVGIAGAVSAGCCGNGRSARRSAEPAADSQDDADEAVGREDHDQQHDEPDDGVEPRLGEPDLGSRTAGCACSGWRRRTRPRRATHPRDRRYRRSQR